MNRMIKPNGDLISISIVVLWIADVDDAASSNSGSSAVSVISQKNYSFTTSGNSSLWLQWHYISDHFNSKPLAKQLFMFV